MRKLAFSEMDIDDFQNVLNRFVISLNCIANKRYTNLKQLKAITNEFYDFVNLFISLNGTEKLNKKGFYYVD